MRNKISINKGWSFCGPDKKVITVDVPHTWNNLDGQDGGNDYCAAAAPTPRPLTAPRSTPPPRWSTWSSRRSTPPPT